MDKTIVLTSPVPEEVVILDEGRLLKHDSVSNVIRDAKATTLDEAL